jgi:hypothetical protein
MNRVDINRNQYNDSIVNTDEPLMSVNKYYKPTVLENEDAAIMLILRLILMEPGTIQTHPNMGVGIVSKFRHSTEIDIGELQRRITKQIKTYLPMFTSVQIRVELDNDLKAVKIYITSDQLYALLPPIETSTGNILDDAKV